MTDTVTIVPRSRREHVAVERLGADNWTLLSKSDGVICLGGQPGVLVRKDNHIRWIPSSQIREPAAQRA